MGTRIKKRSIGKSFVLAMLYFTGLFVVTGKRLKKIPSDRRMILATCVIMLPAFFTVGYYTMRDRNVHAEYYSDQSAAYVPTTTEDDVTEPFEFPSSPPQSIIVDLEAMLEMEAQAYDVTDRLGNDIIDTEFGSLIKQKLPSDFGDPIDFSSFKPMMDYRVITNKSSQAYRVVHNELAYTDEDGFRRYVVDASHQFAVGVECHTDGSITGLDDYVVALGNQYKEKGSAGDRFLIVGENGNYTIIVGDEKDDRHTDPNNIYSYHGNNHQYGGLIEFIVDYRVLPTKTKNSGNINRCDVIVLTGEIYAIYKIS